MTVCDLLPSIGVPILSRETTEETMVGKTDVTSTDYFRWPDLFL